MKSTDTIFTIAPAFGTADDKVQKISTDLVSDHPTLYNNEI